MVRLWIFVQNFFDLSYEEMEYLFYASEYPKENATFPKEVAKRIRKFIADTEKWENRPWAPEEEFDGAV